MQQNLGNPRASEHPRMEQTEQHLADEYVQGFDLEQLEDVTVKREEKARTTTDSETWIPAATEDLVPNGKFATRTSWPTTTDERRLPPISPSTESVYTPQPVLMNMTLINDPSTPPDTPPSHSPIPYNNNRPPGFMDEVMWFPQNVRLEPQPLDLRPNMQCMGSEVDWERKDYVPAGMNIDTHPPVHHLNLHHPIRPQSCSSGGSPASPRRHSTNLTTSDYSSCESLTSRRHHHHHGNVIPTGDYSPCSEVIPSRRQLLPSGPPSDYGSCIDLVPGGRRHHTSGSTSEYSTCGEDYGLSDDLLVSLTVRELNKRVQHLPKDVIAKVKARRRTLKNRGYAQNCRHKRVQQKQDLEELNRSLTEELHRTRIEVSTLLQERDHLKQKLQLLNKNIQGAHQIQHLNPDGQNSPEFYL